MSFTIEPPVEPMLAKLADELPEGDLLYEPKWDGFRALVFRGDGDDEVYIQSRDLRPLDRYFPEVRAMLLEQAPRGVVLDGEIVIATPRGLDFDALQMRLHPAASRVAKLAGETPASFVAFDILAEAGRDLRAATQIERRARLEALLGRATPPLHVTPATHDPATARDWLTRFEGAGLDGVMAKPIDAEYQPGKRAMIKVKHARTADCVVAGFRWYKGGHRRTQTTQTEPNAVGSLLLGLYDERGTLHHVGVTSSFTLATRLALAQELEPLRREALAAHPWREWASAMADDPLTPALSPQAGRGGRMPGGQSRWSAGKDLSWEPLRIERVCEVKYDHLQGPRFRHAAVFKRWRFDKPPSECRYDQLEVTAPYELAHVFGAAGR